MNDPIEDRLRAIGSVAAENLPDRLDARPGEVRRIKLVRVLFGTMASVAVVGVISGSAMMIASWQRETPIPAASSDEGDHVVTLDPDRVRPGDPATLIVEDPPGMWGLAWSVERQVGESWTDVGTLVVGPGEHRTQDFFETGDDGGWDSIGFSQAARMPIEIPALEPGEYRIGQAFIQKDGTDKPPQFQTHFSTFTVLEDD